jgi:hypothetical protein
MGFRNKLECLSLVSFSGLVLTHAILLRKSVNHGQKMFYNIGPWSNICGKQNGATSLSKMTFNIMTLSIMSLFTTLSINDTQSNDTEHNCIKSIESRYAEWH